MNRRTLLTTAAVAVGGLVAGCSGSGNGNASNGTNGSGGTATEAPTESAESATTAPTTRPTGNTETTSPEATTTREPETTDESMKTSGPQTETARVPTTETTPETTTTTAPTTATTEGTETTDTAIAIPDPPSTQEGRGVAQVAFEKGGSRVVVSGVITAENGCQKATLASSQSDGSELVVTIGTERTAGTNTACTQVLTPVEYQFTLTPDSTPESVTVVHATMGKRQTVTKVKREG